MTTSHSSALHPSIAPGGGLDQMLGAARNRAEKCTQKQGINSNWERCASEIRIAFAKLMAATDNRDLPREVLLRAVRDVVIPPGRVCDMYHRDGAVLTFFLLYSLGLTDGALETIALSRYSQRRKEFGDLLGEFIPAHLKSTIEIHLFNSNQNQTALEDWLGFNVLRSNTATMSGQPSGIPVLDAQIGGLSGLTIVAGPTGSGKTSFVLNVALAALRADPALAVLIIEIEMPKASIFGRILSIESGLPLHRILGSDTGEDAKTAIEKADATLKADVLGRLQIVDSGGNGTWELSPGTLGPMISRLQKATGCARCLVVIDSFDRLKTVSVESDDDGHEYIADDEVQSDEARLVMLSGEQASTRSPAAPNGVPLIVITRVRKDRAGEARLTIDDVHGSVDMVHDAECVLLLQRRGESRKGVTPVLLTAAKVRDRGTTGEVMLDFHFETSRFTSPDAAERPAGTLSRKLKSPSRFRGSM